MVPPAKEEDMMVLPKQLIEFIPRLHLARSLDKKDDLNADPDRGERCRNILWLCDLDESQLLDRMNKYHKVATSPRCTTVNLICYYEYDLMRFY